MELIRIDKNNLYFRKATELYERAFCYEERRDLDDLLNVLCDEKYHFCIIYENEFVGIMLYWEFEKYIYLEHFAICEDKRNSGLGKKALELLKAMGKQILLEIEIPDLTDKIRRENFYLRNGFFRNAHYHIQPKYHYGDKDFELIIMSQDAEINKSEYDAFNRLLKEYVEKK